MPRRSLRFLVPGLLAVAALAGAAACGPPSSPRPAAPADARAPATETLTPALAQLVAAADAGSAWGELAARLGVDVVATEASPDAVVVQVDLNGARLTWNDGRRIRAPREVTDGLRARIARVEGAEWIDSASRTRFRLRAPVRALPEVARVVRKHAPTAVIGQLRAPVPQFGRVVSEGVSVTRVPALRAAGLTGRGVQVHVLDSGFQGIGSYAGDEVGTFGRLAGQGDLDRDPNAHGTACIEVIRDVAPDAAVAAYRLDAALDIETATALALANGADLLSVSMAWFGYPWNGPACDAARAAADAGVPWIASSGNYGRKYWEARALPRTTDGFLRLSNGAVENAILEPAGRIQLAFAYEALGPATASLEVTLWETPAGGSPRPVIGGGSGYDQYLSYWPEPGARYGVRIRARGAGRVGRMRLFSYHHRIGLFSTDGAVVNPATLVGVVTVGAVDASVYGIGAPVDPYSSRGGGIFDLPLDLCGPSGVSTASLGFFTGTSCAAPHVAGLAALALEQSPGRDPLRTIRTVDAGAPGWDAATGRGLATGWR